MRKFSISTIALLCMGLMTATFATEAHAQRGKKSKKKAKQRPPKDARTKTPSSPLMRSSKTVRRWTVCYAYTDTVKGSSYLAIPDSMMEREFIYFSHVDDGVAEAVHARKLPEQQGHSFHKHFDRIELHAENTNYYFDQDSPLAKPRMPTSTRPSWRA